MNKRQTPAAKAAASKLASEASETLNTGLTTAADAASGAITQAEESVAAVKASLRASLLSSLSDAEAIARRGIERARTASSTVRAQVDKAGQRTVGYVKAEPVKSVFIAAAVGAASAAVIGWMVRSRSTR